MGPRKLLVIAAVAVLFVAAGVLLHGSAAAPQDAPAPVAPTPPPPPFEHPVASAPPAAPPRRLPAAPSAPSLMTETQIMDRLRELRQSDPPLSLQLARDGNARFPNSPDAAERSWFLVRALSAGGRGDEARDEARKMAAEHPDASWTADVVRHVLAIPP